MRTQIRKSSQHACSVMQDTRSQIRETVLSQMRDSTLLFIHGLFNEEVESLLWTSVQPQGSRWSPIEEDGTRLPFADVTYNAAHKLILRFRPDTLRSRDW